MLAMLLTLRGVAIATAVAAVIGFAGGVKVRDAFCDAATARRDAADARAELERKKLELLVATDQATSTAATLAELQKLKDQADAHVRELQERIDKAEKAGKPDPNAVADARCRVTPAGVREFSKRRR